MRILILLTLGLLPIFCIGQCDDSKRPIRGTMGYQPRGKHCEGFYRSLVSANDLQLVQFTKGRLAYNATQPEDLKLSVPVKTKETVNIRSLGIPRSLFYQMDVVLGAGESFTWNTGTVLLKHQSTKYARLMGLLGFTESNGRRVYVPIQINTPDANQAYQIKLVASVKVQQVKWRLRGQTEYQKIRAGRSFTPGRAISFYLPKGLPGGEYTLEVQGKEGDGVTAIDLVEKIRI